ncbi:hypothetical protein [Phenylobacterium sp.]|uniref:hypothetical protein n=1 Tax=Phenylobacterium sp. TaxID=1871053 RepID=UPI002E313121|nr:hypothetical protein [Phenylobacterium sp.]HEX3367002.1 hypothetical protein [Phenylobacterium sp.]
MRTPKSTSALQLSWCAVIGASPALPLATTPFAASRSDETMRLCRSWSSTEAQIFRWQGQCCDIENYLAAACDIWFELTQDEQRKPPDAAEMFEVDARIDAPRDAREETIPMLPGLVATSREANLIKFEVLATLLRPEGHRDELILLHSARRDVEAAWR